MGQLESQYTRSQLKISAKKTRIKLRYKGIVTFFTQPETVGFFHKINLVIMSIVEDRIKVDNEVLKKVKREIVKSAKKGDFHYYWNISGLSESSIRYIVNELELDKKMVKSKGTSYKIIRW